MDKDPAKAATGASAAKVMEMALELSKALDELEQAIPDKDAPEAKAMLAKLDDALGNLELWAKGHVLRFAPEADPWQADEVASSTGGKLTEQP